MTTKTASYYFNDNVYIQAITIRDSNNQSATTIQKNLNNIDQRITHISTQENVSNFTIDGVINAQVVSQSFRMASISYWTNWRTSYERGAWLCGTATIVGGVGTFASTKYQELFFVTALVGLVMTYFFMKWAQQATVQLTSWEMAPELAIAGDRKMAYKTGFAHVYDQKMKIGSDAKLPRLAPFEVTYLFEKYMGARCQELLSKEAPSSQEKNDWLKKFTSINPVSLAVLNYAYENVPNKFVKITQKYETLTGKLNAIRETAQKKRQGIERETTKQIQNAEKSKKVADDIVDLGSTVFDDRKSRKMARKGASLTTSIIASTQIHQATVEHGLKIATINQEENEALATHYNAAKKILEKAKKI